MPAEPRRPSPVVTAAILGLAGLCWLVLRFTIVTWIPHRVKVFQDYALKLPWTTELAIHLSMLGVDFWWLLAPAVLAVVAAFAALFINARHRSHSPVLAALLAFVLIGTPVLAIAFQGAAVGLAEAKLIQGLSK